MIYLIYGEDSKAARKRLDELLFKREKIDRVDAKKIDEKDFGMLCAIDNMFFDKKTILIESFSLDKKTNEILKIAQSRKDIDFIFYKDEDLDKRQVEKFKADSVSFFPFPKYFYQFMDNLAPKKGKFLFETLNKMSESYTAEQIFYSMIKRLRLLLALESNAEIKEVSTLAEWQKGKLMAQLRFWDKKRLNLFYNKLFDLEVGMKTSALTLPLKNHLDILLLTELK